MFLPIPAMIIAAPLIVNVADQVPSFNISPTCGGDAKTTASGGRTKGRKEIGERGSDICIKGEMAARDELAKQWTKFPAGDRARCVQLAKMTTMPSYVQVITCLEMARESGQLEKSSTTGAAPQGNVTPPGSALPQDTVSPPTSTTPPTGDATKK